MEDDDVEVEDTDIADDDDMLLALWAIAGIADISMESPTMRETDLFIGKNGERDNP